VRRGTSITLIALLVAIFTAAIIQFLIMGK